MSSHEFPRTITARPAARQTRAERFAALASERRSVAPRFKIGDRVTFQGRTGRVTDLHAGASGYLVTVVHYAGATMLGEDHPDLAAE